MLTPEERESLVNRAEESIQLENAATLKILEESSTDFDSLDEFEDENEREDNGFPRLSTENDESDHEPLFNISRKLKSKAKKIN